MDSAAGERFDTPDGRRYFDLDAAEHALGYGLSNQTEFGTLEHPVTREKDGAIFAIFLRERKFSYFASDAQDRRGLGESNWIGQLDRPAYRAMTSGGRIVDAVRDTVSNINRQLNDRIQAEANAARRAREEQQRSIEFLRTGLLNAETSIKEVEEKSKVFREEHPSAAGPMSEPPLVEWRKRLSELGGSLTPDKTRANEQSLTQLSAEIAKYLNAYAAATDLSVQRKKIEEKIAQYRDSPNGVANRFIDQARIAMQNAERDAEAGVLDFSKSVQQAESHVAAIDQAIIDERERIRLRILRQNIIRGTVLAMLGIFAMVIAGWLWF